MEVMYKLDKSNNQGWICPPFANRLDWANFTPMTAVVDMESIRAALRVAIERKSIPPTTLSLRVGNNKTLVKDLLEKTNDVRLSTLTKLAGELDVPVSDLLLPPQGKPVGPWLPSAETIAAFLVAAAPALLDTPDPEVSRATAARAIVAALQSLSLTPDEEDNAGVVRMLCTQIDRAISPTLVGKAPPKTRKSDHKAHNS